MGFTAIFGGTFNPPHLGHRQMLESLEKMPEVDEIWFMPDNIPPHKVCDCLAEDEDRIQMCRLCISGLSKVKLCLAEFEREGKSYTYDTVCRFKEEYPEKRFAFVCGGDMLISFDRWYRFKDLINMLDFIVFKRSGEEDGIFYDKLDYFKKIGMNVTVNNTEILSVSSSAIRKNPYGSREMLPEKVYDYIISKGLYNA